MKDKTRACRLALCLGPCGAGASLKETEPTPDSLESLWPHRLAHAFWEQASAPHDLLRRAQRLLARMDREGTRVVLATDEDYPRRLWRLTDAPGVLFVKGRIPRGHAAAMVGSRAAYRAGMTLARAAAADLARRGVTIVSGGALGIDTAAHEGALDGGGRTVVFLGSGLDRPYPERNLDLFHRVAVQGAVVSSFAPGTPPLRGCFPRRNRLIAALSEVVVVVEAAARSGALQTARWAERLEVPVLAGNTSAGARRLLGRGAGLFESAEDVTRVLDGEEPRRQRNGPADEDQRALLERLEGDPLSVDELATALGWSAPRTAATLIRMEVQGLVRLGAGGRYSVDG